LIHNERYTRKVLPFITNEYFSSGAYQEVFKLVKAFVGKYNTIPPKEALLIELNEKQMGDGIHKEASQIIQFAIHEPSDDQWLLDTTEKWCQERAIYNSIMQSISILEGNDKKHDKHAIPKILQDALGVCFDSRVGHNYFRDAELQWEYYHNVLNKVPFNLDIMNRVTKGGCTRKTLSIVQAGINVGKTTWLINMAENYLEQGLNVAYFTLEVAEEVIRERSDVCFNDLTFDELRAMEKVPYLNRVKKLRDKTKGEFIIREFPSSSVHVGHFRHALNEIKTKENIKIDVIIVDYLTLMLSSLLPSSAKSNTNTYFTSVAEELRGLMIEFDVIGWTAAQFNRTGQDSDNVSMSDIGAAIGIAAVADFMVAFMAPDDIAKLGKALGKVLKNRFANKQTIGKFMIGLNNDKQKYYDVSDDDQRAVMDDSEYAAHASVQTPTPVSKKAADWTFAST
jgi:hypothetical protein